MRKNCCRGLTLTTLFPSLSNWFLAAMIDKPVFSTNSSRENATAPAASLDSTNCAAAPRSGVAGDVMDAFFTCTL